MKWSDWNLPPGVFNSDPHFNDESGEECEHSAPACKACVEELLGPRSLYRLAHLNDLVDLLHS